MGSKGGGGSSGIKNISSQQSDTLRSWCDAHCLQPRLMARAREIRNNLEKMLQRFAPIDTPLSSCGDDTVAVRKCLVAGYFAHAAQLGSDGRYWTVRGRHPVAVHSLSVLARFGAPPEWVSKPSQHSHNRYTSLIYPFPQLPPPFCFLPSFRYTTLLISYLSISIHDCTNC